LLFLIEHRALASEHRTHYLRREEPAAPFCSEAYFRHAPDNRLLAEATNLRMSSPSIAMSSATAVGSHALVAKGAPIKMPEHAPAIA